MVRIMDESGAMDTDAITDATTDEKKNEEETNPKLVAWECFGLACEEHVHAMTLYAKNKNGKPLGHR